MSSVDIPDSWRIPDDVTSGFLGAPAPQLRVDGPRATATGRSLAAIETHAFVHSNLSRVGQVLAVAIDYLPHIGEYITAIRGTDGLLRVYGYMVGTRGGGARFLAILLSRIGLAHSDDQITGDLEFEAGERTWTKAGFNDRELQVRKVRGR